MSNKYSYDSLLLQYINLESEIEIAQRHKLSINILLDLKKEKKEIKEKLDQLILVHHASNK